MTNKTHDTREGWLKAAIVELDKEFFAVNGYKLPKKLGVSCGFPYRGGPKAVGQCFDPEVAKDGSTHMFICPSQAEPVRVLDILLHEMIHSSVGIKAGHKGPFRKLVKEFGLAGKMTATFAEEGSELYKTLSKIAKRIGKYPHASMQKKTKATKPNPWIRFVSPITEKYTVVVNIKKVMEYGVPKDWKGNDMEPKNDKLKELFEMWG